MVFNTGAALLDAIVLAVVSQDERKEPTATRLPQDVRGVLDVSESTLYPVLRESFRKMTAWRSMTRHMRAATADTIS